MEAAWEETAPPMGLVLHRLAAFFVLAFEALACLASVILLMLLSAAPLYSELLPGWPVPWAWAAMFIGACALAVAASWVKGIFDKRLPARIGGEPRHAHISGWTFVWIVMVASVIVALATWASQSDTNRAVINTDWGVGIMIGLAVAFVAAALAPTVAIADHASGLISFAGRFVRPFGRFLSILDSILVFAIAGGAGATQRSMVIRYVMLLGTLGSCAAMGYWLEPPWGLVPLAWGFLVAIAISRRWAWIETDRELAMLNRRFVGSHLRIGFAQDMRDEALLSFASLLLLAPLALRQAQIAALGADFELFNTDIAAARDLSTWIGFFGAELAKAVPFVDWAEVYDVGGADEGLVRSPIAHHFVFATRILVDLVFLAALLQALSISARNATQRGLFYEGQLDRLDPFLEPREFRKLMRRGDKGALAPDPERVAAFPEYDPIRLSELAGDDDRGRVFRAAVNAVRVHQGGSNVAEFHTELARRLHLPERDKIAILEVVNAIRAAGPVRDIVLLDQLRRELNHVPRLIEVRTELTRLICEAPLSAEKTTALASAIEHDRDSLGPVRLAALSGLAEAAQRGDREAGFVLQRAMTSPGLTKPEQRSVREMLARIDRRAPLARAAVTQPTPEPQIATQPERAPEPALKIEVDGAAAPLHREVMSKTDDADIAEAPLQPEVRPEIDGAEFENAELSPAPALEEVAFKPPMLSQEAPQPRPRARMQTRLEWAALATFAIVGAGWIYLWQNSGAFDR